MEPPTIYHGWMWDMFREYVRKITRTASRGAMPEEEMKERFGAMRSDFEIKVLAMDKVGMTIYFRDLDVYPVRDVEKIVEDAEFIQFLFGHYGHGKFKINLYHQGTFIATKNFETPEGPETWREIWTSREGKA
jgi:hypothetical protein